jgi:SRSO17 transposase
VRGCDPSGFPTSGRESVGGARQWGGRLGTVDPCQGAMYWGYVSRQGPPLVDTRLSLPTAWTKAQARLAKAGVPKGARGYRRRHQLAWERVAQNGAGLPHSGSAGDAERGRPSWCRRHLAAVGERYGLAVPSPTPRRALEVEPPE